MLLDVVDSKQNLVGTRSPAVVSIDLQLSVFWVVSSCLLFVMCPDDISVINLFHEDTAGHTPSNLDDLFIPDLNHSKGKRHNPPSETTICIFTTL